MDGVTRISPVESVAVAENPCLTCGACCAFYRVSFYWAEADAARGGTVPVELTEKLDPFRRCMKGTNQPAPRCSALFGVVGQRVSCAIYADRPSPCREFGVQWEAGVLRFTPDDLERCSRARAAWGLPPLSFPAPQSRPERAA